MNVNRREAVDVFIQIFPARFFHRTREHAQEKQLQSNLLFSLFYLFTWTRSTI